MTIIDVITNAPTSKMKKSDGEKITVKLVDLMDLVFAAEYELNHINDKTKKTVVFHNSHRFENDKKVIKIVPSFDTLSKDKTNNSDVGMSTKDIHKHGKKPNKPKDNTFTLDDYKYSILTCGWFDEDDIAHQITANVCYSKLAEESIVKNYINDMNEKIYDSLARKYKLENMSVAYAKTKIHSVPKGKSIKEHIQSFENKDKKNPTEYILYHDIGKYIDTPEIHVNNVDIKEGIFTVMVPAFVYYDDFFTGVNTGKNIKEALADTKQWLHDHMNDHVTNLMNMVMKESVDLKNLKDSMRRAYNSKSVKLKIINTTFGKKSPVYTHTYALRLTFKIIPC